MPLIRFAKLRCKGSRTDISISLFHICDLLDSLRREDVRATLSIRTVPWRWKSTKAGYESKLNTNCIKCCNSECPSLSKAQAESMAKDFQEEYPTWPPGLDKPLLQVVDVRVKLPVDKLFTLMYAAGSEFVVRSSVLPCIVSCAYEPSQP